jgi:hypothetical protein
MTNLPSSASVFRVARCGLVLAAAALALAACSSNGSPPSSTGAGAESSPADAALGSFAGVTFHGSIYVRSQNSHGPKAWQMTKTFVQKVPGIHSCADAAKTGDWTHSAVFRVPTATSPVPEDSIELTGLRGPGTYQPHVMRRDKSDFIVMPGKSARSGKYIISSSVKGLKPGKEEMFLNPDGSGQLVYSEAHLNGKASGAAVAGLISWTCTTA